MAEFLLINTSNRDSGFLCTYVIVHLEGCGDLLNTFYSSQDNTGKTPTASQNFALYYLCDFCVNPVFHYFNVHGDQKHPKIYI